MTDEASVESTSRRGLAVDLGPALGLLLFHLALLPGYGVFRDELYYMACGRHPGWGYVDHPPLVGWVAWVVRQVAGDSHLALRVVAAVAAAATVLMISFRWDGMKAITAAPMTGKKVIQERMCSPMRGAPLGGSQSKGPDKPEPKSGPKR